MAEVIFLIIAVHRSNFEVLNPIFDVPRSIVGVLNLIVGVRNPIIDPRQRHL
ncbi:hypothetical protein [Epilithonimonas lactis]|nr:hypothetical protein [Epilithonimonas lactis]